MIFTAELARFFQLIYTQGLLVSILCPVGEANEKGQSWILDLKISTSPWKVEKSSSIPSGVMLALSSWLLKGVVIILQKWLPVIPPMSDCKFLSP